jgi:hypothetical protein
VRLTFPLRHLGRNRGARASMEMPVNGSLESAGSRLALIGRLMDEHNPGEFWAEAEDAWYVNQPGAGREESPAESPAELDAPAAPAPTPGT